MKNKFATVITGAMLFMTTITLPSLAIKLENPINQTTSNSTILLARANRQEGWITRQQECRKKKIYNRRKRKHLKVKICRRVQTKTDYPDYY